MQRKRIILRAKLYFAKEKGLTTVRPARFENGRGALCIKELF